MNQQTINIQKSFVSGGGWYTLIEKNSIEYGGSIWLIRKCCIPRVFKHVQEKLREKSLEVPTVSKQKQMEGQKEKDSCNMVDLMNYIEQQLNKQNHQLELLARRLNEAQPTH